MKCWTLLVLLVAVCAVFLGVGHSEETEDDFKETALEDVQSDTKDDACQMISKLILVPLVTPPYVHLMYVN